MSVHLVTGADPLLRDDAAAALVAELLGSDDRTLAVEEFTIPGRGEGDDGTAEGREGVVGNVVNAASSPPFMTERRIVVVREIGALRAGDVAPLLAYLEAPLDTTELVLVAGGGKTPDALERQLRDRAAVTAPPATRAADVLAREVEAAGLSLTEAASESVLAHVGEDAGLVPGLVATLQATHGDGDRLDVAEVEPYLGEAGSIPNWDLTNAIERGDISRALAAARRLLTVTSPLQPRPLHPLQITGLLHGHYRRLLVLDDPAVRTSEDAAAAIGGRTSPRAAGFRLRQTRALGSDGLRRAFDLLAQADLDVKGARAIPADVVVELLVARLAALAPAGGRRSGPSSRRPSRRAS
jgi:DNA polymerase III subunit delta